MIRLYLKECKEISKSLIYLVYVVITLASFISQYLPSANSHIHEDNKPIYVSDVEKYYEENGKYPYGTKEPKFVAENVSGVFNVLWGEYYENKYLTNVFGFGKNISLSGEKKQKVEDILTRASGKTIGELESIMNSSNKEQKDLFLKNMKVDFEEFKSDMQELNKLLGGKSTYSEEKLNMFHSIGKPLTYEEAVEEYDKFINSDGVLGAFARPFTYIISLVTSIASALVVIFFTMRDKQSKMQELIYSKKYSSAVIIITRYLALITMLMLPIFILGIYTTIYLSSSAKALNPNYDYLAFIKYSIVWVAPTILVVSSAAMFFTLLTDTHLGVVIQVIWWIQTTNLPVDYFGIKSLILRFHYFGGRTELLEQNSNLIIENRIFYTVLAIIFLVLSIWIYSMKRSGKLNVGRKVSGLISNIRKKPKDSLAA